ncbi:MAG: biotin--[acetyl-CoA-carboxylase] ligase [Phycisphaerae bacterium]|nr:biotin--[acetyl-CoA-carboxylase] ligase [Phycisphaerae bacterium]
MHPAADNLLTVLYARRAYASLDELASEATLSRAAAVGALDALRQRGVVMEESPAGLRLARPVGLNAHLIEHGLGTRRVGRNAIVFGEVESTNDVALDSSRQANADGLVVLAESQRAGRGRLGRRWASPAGANVLMSVLLLDEQARLSSEALTIAAGLAVAEAVERAVPASARLKWPNDVLIDDAKVCGILVEVRRHPCRAVVVGVGINVNAAPPPEAVTRPATCLADHAQGPLERIELIRDVLRNLDAWIQQITDNEDNTTTDNAAAPHPSPTVTRRLHDQWLARCGMMNQRVTVRAAGQRVTGRVLDIDPLEGLILQTDTGQQLRLPAATSSVE